MRLRAFQWGFVFWHPRFVDSGAISGVQHGLFADGFPVEDGELNLVPLGKVDITQTCRRYHHQPHFDESGTIEKWCLGNSWNFWGRLRGMWAISGISWTSVRFGQLLGVLLDRLDPEIHGNIWKHGTKPGKAMFVSPHHLLLRRFGWYLNMSLRDFWRPWITCTFHISASGFCGKALGLICVYDCLWFPGLGFTDLRVRQKRKGNSCKLYQIMTCMMTIICVCKESILYA